MMSLAVLVAVLVVAVLGRATTLPATADLVAESTVREGSRPLVVRFIDRSRRFRRNGALAGLVLAAVAITIYRAESPQGDLGAEVGIIPIAAIGFGGSVAGSILAEAFRFGRRRGPRAASLEVRDPSTYDDPLVSRREQVLAVTALSGAVVALTTGVSTVRVVALLCGVALLVLLRRWGTRRIALRGRPAMPVELREADDQVRRMAVSSGLGRPVTILMALVISLLWGSTVATANGTVAPVVAVVSATALWVVATIWWFENRSFGLVRTDGHPINRWGLGALVLVVLAVLVVVPFVVIALRILIVAASGAR